MDHERIIHIFRCLSTRTDSSHAVSVRDIQNYLFENSGMENVSAVTIRRDIDRLIAMGNDIEISYGSHNTACYRLCRKGFTFNEIRFVTDAVSVSKFLSPQQKQRFIKKFEGMCSENETRQLIRRISLNDIGIPSLDILENLENIYSIIEQRRKIVFDYGKFNTDRKMIYYTKNRDVIPLKVRYFSERFYLRCYDSTEGVFRTYRIDRMKNITAGERAGKRPELPEDRAFVVNIFEPDFFETVTLLVNKTLLDEMLEKLGRYSTMRPDPKNADRVIVRVYAGVNKQFYEWVMRFGDDMEILSPKYVRDEFAQLLRRVLGKYLK